MVNRDDEEFRINERTHETEVYQNGRWVPYNGESQVPTNREREYTRIESNPREGEFQINERTHETEVYRNGRWVPYNQGGHRHRRYRIETSGIVGPFFQYLAPIAIVMAGVFLVFVILGGGIFK